MTRKLEEKNIKERRRNELQGWYKRKLKIVGPEPIECENENGKRGKSEIEKCEIEKTAQ